MKKTTYSSYLVQTYNRCSGIKNPTRLNASIPAAIKMLSDIQDDVVIFDDLFPADSQSISNKQEETLIEITRYIGDGTVPAKMRGQQVQSEPPKCGVLFTGEYVIGSGSDAARLLPIEMQDVDGAMLKGFQDNPLYISTFYRFFIKWAIDNYDRIVIILKNMLKAYRQESMNVHPRLQETHFFLNSANVLLIEYLKDREFLKDDDCKKLRIAFANFLMNLVKQQNKRVEKKNTTYSNTENYLETIKSLYNGGEINYAADVVSYEHEYHDGVIYDNCLCLRGEWFNKVFIDVPYVTIANELEKQGALNMGKGKNQSRQISKLGGKRFYFIPLNRL